MATNSNSYPARLDIDYPTKKLDRLTTFFRVIWALPILFVLTFLTSAAIETTMGNAGSDMRLTAGGLVSGLFVATLLMILFRQRYPRWWFDFVVELNRFSMRVSAYLLLLTDQYPSTTDKQTVHLDLKYPDVKQDLSRGLPLVKWLLAVPHYIALFVLGIAAFVAVVIAWFAILFTGQYPKSLFDFVVGVSRWNLRVSAYAFLLITDEYPPFSLK